MRGAAVGPYLARASSIIPRPRVQPVPDLRFRQQQIVADQRSLPFRANTSLGPRFDMRRVYVASNIARKSLILWDTRHRRSRRDQRGRAAISDITDTGDSAVVAWARAPAQRSRGGRKCRGCARGPTTTAAPQCSSHAVARRARAALPGSPRPPRRLARVELTREFEPGVAAGVGVRERAAHGGATCTTFWPRRVRGGFRIPERRLACRTRPESSTRRARAGVRAVRRGGRVARSG